MIKRRAGARNNDMHVQFRLLIRLLQYKHTYMWYVSGNIITESYS